MKLECIGLIMNTSECIICKSPATKTVKNGNPKYIDKPVCEGYIDMEHDKFINSFGQLFHSPKCWKVEVSKLRVEYGV